MGKKSSNRGKNPLARISVDPKVCHGKPVIKGTRIMVWIIVNMLAGGDSVDDILKAYPQLDKEDVLAALSYAAELARERVVEVKGG